MKTMVSKTPISSQEYKAFHINRIVSEYPDLRQASKTSTFALQYAGTPVTLVSNSGFTQEEAESIYTNYHLAYSHSLRYTDARKLQASKDGYATVAFGLKVRTPLLSRVLLDRGGVPREAQAEARTVGNAFSQSYGMLNNRACNDFMQKVWLSRYRYDILPSAMIHDAIYILVKDDIDVIEWANRELIKSMEWQELPELEHDTVKIGAALDVFYPNWASPCTLTNYADKKEIRATCAAFLEKLADKQKEAA